MGVAAMSIFAVIDVPSLKVLKAYGDLPERVDWPNGDSTHGAYVGFTHGNEMFVSVIEEPEQPTEFHGRKEINLSLRGSALVQTVTWEPFDLEAVKGILVNRLDSSLIAHPNLVLSLLDGNGASFAKKRNDGHAAIRAATTVEAAIDAHDQVRF
jgi:hypothetical protein